ncbi:hypothetical protein RJT34_04563 [Clitoria ternatea]|uniref:Uncharacterized protein n=1 Tax=Clitoria ternatea TaxID=43366 RepID=A0AAN9Q0P3_CLITE
MAVLGILGTLGSGHRSIVGDQSKGGTICSQTCGKQTIQLQPPFAIFPPKNFTLSIHYHHPSSSSFIHSFTSQFNEHPKSNTHVHATCPLRFTPLFLLFLHLILLLPSTNPPPPNFFYHL